MRLQHKERKKMAQVDIGKKAGIYLLGPGRQKIWNLDFIISKMEDHWRILAGG